MSYEPLKKDFVLLRLCRVGTAPGVLLFQIEDQQNSRAVRGEIHVIVVY